MRHPEMSTHKKREDTQQSAGGTILRSKISTAKRSILDQFTTNKSNHPIIKKPTMMRPSLIVSSLIASAHAFGAPNPAFVPYHGEVHPAPPALDSADAIDFDAPVDRLQASGHLVEKATSVLDHDIIVDDDCYMGKDVNAGECVDFDPVHKNTRTEEAVEKLEWLSP